MLEPFASELSYSIGWALLEFVWQGALVGTAAAVVLTCLRRQTAQIRYVVACVGLVVMIALPLENLFTGTSGFTSDVVPSLRAETVGAPAGRALGEGQTPRLSNSSQIIPSEIARAVSMNRLEAWMPIAVALWIAGVIMMWLRVIGGWLLLQRMRRIGIVPSAEMQQCVQDVAHRLRVSRPIITLESALVSVPTVIGWLRPVILLPASALTGLSREQLEAVIAHEVAHIRRHDYLVNMFQTLVETLLFYHPAVWWLSHRIRVEREHCSDDLALRVCSSPVVYASALTRLEERRQDVALAMSATGGPLIGRIRRIMGLPRPGPRRISGWFWAAALLLVLAFGLAIPDMGVSTASATRLQESPVFEETLISESPPDLAVTQDSEVGTALPPQPPLPPAPPPPPPPARLVVPQPPLLPEPPPVRRPPLPPLAFLVPQQEDSDPLESRLEEWTDRLREEAGRQSELAALQREVQTEVEAMMRERRSELEQLEAQLEREVGVMLRERQSDLEQLEREMAATGEALRENPVFESGYFRALFRRTPTVCRFEVDREVAIAVRPTDRLEVRAGAGSLRVEGREGLEQVRATAEACASDEDRLDDLQVTIERNGDAILLTTRYPDSFDLGFGDNAARIDLVVEMPLNMSVEIEDSSGSMEVSGAGALEIEDDSGSIEVRSVTGHVTIDDKSGSLRVEDAAGDVEIEDGSGSIDVRNVGGSLSVIDGSGSIRAAQVGEHLIIEEDGSGSISVTDVGEDVIIEEDGSGSISVRNIAGALVVRRDGGGRISYSGVQGPVDIPEDKR